MIDRLPIKDLHPQIILNRLFTNFYNFGFWDPLQNKIIERLDHDSNWNWSYHPSNSYRYGLFTMGMILLANEIYNLDISKYEDKVIKYLRDIARKAGELSISDLTYGGLLSLVLGQKIFSNNFIDSEDLIKLFDQTLLKISPVRNNHDALILIPGKYIQELYYDDNRQKLLEYLIDQLLKVQDKNGFFQTGDIRSLHHQRCMYPLWGLAVFSTCLKNGNLNQKIQESIKRSLKYVWTNRRDIIDDAFLWHPRFYWIKVLQFFKIPIFVYKSSNYLFECHQTFFANAINFFQYAYKSAFFQNEKIKSLLWIFGKNRIQKNLVEITGIDLPARIMHRNGDLFVPGNQFKGSYEVGSYLLVSSEINSQQLEYIL